MADTERPLGNKWEFSEENHKRQLRPGIGREITSSTMRLQELAGHVQKHFIVEGWQFVSLVEALPKLDVDNGYSDLFVIFTHPARTALAEEIKDGDDISQFIRPEVVQASRDIFWKKFYRGTIPPADDPMNQILRGTNRVVTSIHAQYNEITDGGRAFLQTGVGYFNINLWPVDRRIAMRDQVINDRMKDLLRLQQERSALLALWFPNPVPLSPPD